MVNLDPAAVDAEMARVLDLLEAETTHMAELAQAEAVARARRDAERAKAFLRAEGAATVREATAAVATEQLDLEYRIAAAKAEAQRELLRSLRTNLDALRTLAANLRQLTSG